MPEDRLRQALLGISPEHDTPIGVVHPYWARKPMNMVEAIIEQLTEAGDLVVDPFMGSGTTIFAALRSNRRALGSDISPLSQYLVSGLIDIAENEEIVLPELERILSEHSRLTLPWFEFDEANYVERSRFAVRGEFADGAFELEPTEIVTKRFSGESWSGRQTHSDDSSLSWTPRLNDTANEHAYAPINFASILLPINSRIAIPRGATLAHYFTPENQASINVFLKLVQESTLSSEHSSALKLVLSASLPLLRLSDKKASSQWPYWRPKTDLTSRNPVIVMADRYKRITKMIDWSRENLALTSDERKYDLLALAAQDITFDLTKGGASLVLTDPPYGDQVPYVEYSVMWNGVLQLKVPSHANAQELVRSDAIHRRSDTSDYLARLKISFIANASLVKPGGYLVWFYQDQDLHCWNAIYEAAIEANVQLLDVIPLPKQRRSLKTVTSPNTTLDGDLLCVFTAAPSGYEAPKSSARESERTAESTGLSYFDRYAALISSALKSGKISSLALKYGTVKRALASAEG